MKQSFVSRPARRAGQVVLALLLASAGFAQMGGGGMMGGSGGSTMGDGSFTNGGMMGGSGFSNGGMMGDGSFSNGGMMGDGSGSMMGSGGFMNGGMMGGSTMWYGVPAVGPDGSAYVIRRAGGTATQSTWDGQLNQKAELVAISPTGAARLLVNIEGTTVSQPVTSRDGRIFVTTSESNMSWYSNTGTYGNTSTVNRKPSLVIVVPATGQTRTVNIDADYVSAPKVADEGNTGSYVVYVVASQTGQQFGQSGAGTFLYGFSADGTQRFKVQLAQ